MKNERHFSGKASTILVIALLLSLVPGCISLKPVPDSIQPELEDAIKRGFDGIIVYVDQSSDSMLYAAGWKDRDKKIPTDPNALFKIASISKLYIAVATAKMINDQKLSLDQTLAELIPDLADRIEYSEEITLRMMLQHRSGIPDFIDLDFDWVNPPQENRLILEPVLDQPAEFKPGKRYKYSNTNYLLIGEILDSTLGYSHHQYIRQEVLEPLGLMHTYFLLSEVDVEDIACGYHVDYDGGDIKYVSYVVPGGSMIATAQDVGVFLRALIDGKLLNDDEQEIYSSVYKYGHTGELPGYQSIARYNEDIDAVVVQFTNTSGGNTWSKSESVYRRVVRILKKDI